MYVYVFDQFSHNLDFNRIKIINLKLYDFTYKLYLNLIYYLACVCFKN